MSFFVLASEALLMFVVYRLVRRREISPVLSAAICCFVAMWHVVPVLIAVPMWNVLARIPVVDFDAFARMATIDAITMALSLTLLLSTKPSSRHSRAATSRACASAPSCCSCS